ncbi:Helicase associated domain protein [Parabacteroides merdae]|uniref:Helicase associated domain protein n=2 Tax=Parabacteroides merdae TaxID=46503 RepID=UPI0034A0D165
MKPSLTDCYCHLGFQVTESEDLLWVGFKAGMVHAIVKEVWNERPLTRSDAELFYKKFSSLNKVYRNLYFRIVAHGGFLPEALDFELHGLAVSDESYIESLLSGRHVELYPHNEAAYRAITQGFKQHRIGAVVQATGTGKSYLLARYIADHAKEKILVFAPNITILDEIRKTVGFSAPQVTYRTFQSLIRNREDNGLLRAAHILIDEFHHFGAEIWGSALQEVIENNPCANVLGTSATPIRPEGMIDTVDLYFEGNLFYELTLPQAWYYNILPVPVLVQSAYGLDNELDRLQRKLERSGCSKGRKEKVQRKLDLARVDFKEALGAPEVIRKFLPTSVRKLLVFCRDLTDLKQMVPEVCGWLTRAGRDIIPFEIHHTQGERQNGRILDAFREESDRLHVLFSVNMLIEGLHVEGVDAVLFLRRTESYIVTLQQLGRCLDAGAGKQPVVLDFVNNLSGKSVYDVMAPHLERLSLLPSPKGFEGNTSFLATGFLSDIRLRIEEILAELEPWQIMYERLIEFRREENDWPSVTEGKLGLWCNTQRIAYKRGKLQEERRRQLESIGFEWNQLDSKWMKEYCALKVFLDMYGHWPKREDGPLATWCYTQRERRKDGRLSKERIRALDEIGFVWNQDLQGEWVKNYEELKFFVGKYRRFPKSTEGNLGGWCHTQRKMRKQGKLSHDRRLLLDKLGFVWSAEQVWQSNFEQLCLFHNQQGRWPGCREGALGRWCTIQRRDYRKGNMSDERKAQLERIGFPLI